ncbi:MAG: HAD family hydrolase [Candidatus Hermodarchaeota archaeon]
MNVKGIIFDFGFTLYYFRDATVDRYFDCYRRGLLRSIELLEKEQILNGKAHVDNFKRLFNKKRMNLFRKSMKTKIEHPTSKIFKIVLNLMIKKNYINEFEEKVDSFYDELADLYHSCEEEEWIPFENTRATLEKLKEYKDLKIAVLSNHPHHPSVEKLLKKYDLFKYFDIVVTSAQFGKRKPDPEIFHHTLKKMGLDIPDSDSCLICGDEHADIVGGHRAGLKTILCERIVKFPFEKEIDHDYYVKITDISEILKYVN